MKRLLSAMALAVIGTVSASAAHINCAAVETAGGARTLDAFVALGADGCVDQDKTYSNFTYDPLASGVMASAVQVVVDTVNLPGTDQHSVNFQSAGWASRFLIGFDVMIMNSPGTYIETVAFDLTAPRTANSSIAFQQNNPNVGPDFTLQATRNNGGEANGLNVQSIRVDIDGQPAAGFTINQVANTFYQQVAPIPEPGTLMSIGLGFLSLGLYRRKR